MPVDYQGLSWSSSLINGSSPTGYNLCATHKQPRCGQSIYT